MNSAIPLSTEHTSIIETDEMSVTPRMQNAIEQLKKLGTNLPTSTTLIDMKTNNVFAEPGT